MANMDTMIALTEDLLNTLIQLVGYKANPALSRHIELQNGIPRLKWVTKSVSQLIYDHTGLEVGGISGPELRELLGNPGGHAVDNPGGYAVGNYEESEVGKETTKWGNLVMELFKQRVEPKLEFPTHVTGFPLDVSPYACREEGRISRRFESYLGGVEIANGCSEECNPIKVIDNLGSGAGDEMLLNALGYGMPPTGGLGIGVDRVVMAVLGVGTVRGVQTFQTLRRVG